MVHSPNHMDLQEPPQMERAMTGKKKKAKERGTGCSKKSCKEKCLSVYDVTELIKGKEITSRL